MTVRMPPFYGTNEMFGDHHEGIGSILKKRLRYIYIPFEPGDVVVIFEVKMERPPKQCPNFSNQNRWSASVEKKTPLQGVSILVGG